MKCRYCGETIEGDVKFCPFCGKKVGSEYISNEEGKYKSESAWFKRPNDYDLTSSDDSDIWTDKRVNESSKLDEETIEQTETELVVEVSHREQSPDDRTIITVGNQDKTRIVSILQGIEKKYIAIAAAVAAACIIILCYVLIPHTVNEPCDHCNRRPSVAFETSDGSKAYVCLECMKTCMLCDRKRATHHYENMLGTIIFVCDDCYKDVISD